MIALIVAGSASYTAGLVRASVSWRNLLAEASLTDAGLPATAPRSNAVSEDTVSFWGPTGAATLRGSLGAATAAGVAFVAAHNLGTEGRTLTVQYHNGTVWADIATVAPASNEPFAVVFPDVTATQFGVSVDGACQIGVVWIGPRVVLPSQVAAGYVPVSGARTVELLPGLSRTGHFLRRQRLGATAEIEASLTPMAAADFAGLAELWARYRSGRPFVWLPAPATLSEAAYCWASDGRVGQQVLGGGALVSATLRMQAFAGWS